MDLLLDTHTFLWFSVDDPQLSLAARQALVDPANKPHLSVATLWELAIKVQLGKLRLHAPFEDVLKAVYAQQRLTILNISQQHLHRYFSLPLEHRDPFDRMIIAQSLADGLTIVGNDAAMDAYGIRRLW